MKKHLLFLISILFWIHSANAQVFYGNGFRIDGYNARFEGFDKEVSILFCNSTTLASTVLNFSVQDTEEYTVRFLGGGEYIRFQGGFRLPENTDVEIRKTADSSLLVRVRFVNYQVPSLQTISLSSPSLQNDTLYLCQSLTPFFEASVDYSSRTCNYGSGETLPFRGRWFVNNQPLPSSPGNLELSLPVDLNDGDQLKVVLYEDRFVSRSAGFNVCDCYNFYDDSIASQVITVKVRSNKLLPKPQFQNGIDHVNPGDTLHVAHDALSKEAYWNVGRSTNNPLKTLATQRTSFFYYTKSKSPDNCYEVSEKTTAFVDNPGYKLIRGYVYEDLNNNGVYDIAKERVFPNVKVQLENTSTYAITDASGAYRLHTTLSAKTYKKVVIVDENYAQLPFPYPPLPFDSLYQAIDVATFPLSAADLALSMSSSRSRPGFATTLYVNITNKGKKTMGGTLTATLDHLLSYDQASQTPSAIEGSRISFTIPPLSAGQTSLVTIYTTLPSTVSLGTALVNKAVLTTTVPEDPLSNNTVEFTTTVTGSFDPNDIEVTPKGIGTKGYIRDTTRLEYVVRFQNMGTDTAFHVVVKSKLPAGLDLGSFKMLTASHPYQVSFREDTIVWTFAHILLPDHTTHEAKSHGLIRFALAQKPKNPNSTSIQNQAAIYFDFNAPVLTNLVLNTVNNTLTDLGNEEGSQTNGLYPNPCDGILYVTSASMGILSIFDPRGMLVHQVAYDGSTKIELPQLPKGVYFYQLEHKTGKLVLR